MNILHFTFSLAQGGRRNAILNLCSGLSENNVTSYACSISSLSQDDYKKLETNKLNGIYSLEHNGHYFPHRTKLLSKLNSICRQHDIDLIHTHDAASQILAALLYKKNKTPHHIYTFHRSLSTDTSGVKNKLRNFYANHKTDIITVGSNERREHLLKENILLSDKKIKLIPFGIDLDRYYHSDTANHELRNKFDIKDTDVVLGGVGHFGKEKGIDIILRSFSELDKYSNNKNIKLIIVGKGNHKQTSFINNLANDLNISAKVIFPGFDNHIEKWYSCFDIFLHAPRKEAFGLVAVEAMAAGIPVIATRVGGLIDIVEHNKSGYLVNPNSASELARYTQKLIDNSQNIHKYGNHGFDLACTKYSLSRFANEYYKLYSTLTDKINYNEVE